MDDLDHSIHISEFDWTSFYEESEECVLRQAALACPDDSSLSDSEESVDIDSALSTSEGDTQQSTDASTYSADRNCGAQEESCARELQGNANEDEDVTRAELCLDVVHVRAGEDIAEGNGSEVTNALQSENVPSSGGQKTKDRNVQTGNDLEPTKEPDPLSCNPKGQNANETPAAEGTVSEAVSDVPLRAEKERWFVTVNANPARKRAAAVKKKRRQKKLRDGSQTRSTGRDKPFESLAEKNEERHQTEKGDDSQSDQCVANRAAKLPSSETNVSDSSQLTETSGEEEDRVPERLSITSSQEANVPATMLMSSSQPAFTPSQLERAESDELDDSAEFLSTHSYDSESYLSAAESVEEHQFPAGEIQLLHRSLCPTSDTSLFTLPGDTNRREAHMDACDSFIRVAETNSGRDQSQTPELPLTFPSPQMSADSPPCSDGADSASLCVTRDASGTPTHQPKLSVPGCSQEDQPSPSVPPVPGLTVTPCPPADTPETFAQGHTRPVYAISAFWDEMEKLTINDILQLRMRRSSSPVERQEPATQTEDPPKSPAPQVEAADDGGVSGSTLMDTSDTTDSDYFTQADESKPDRSSCEFSTSDFEEEYWQFLGTSRNASPDAGSKKRESDASFSQHGEESAGSEGKQTPVPAEEPARQRLDLLALSEPAAPRQIRKSKSLRNVPASATTPSLLDDEDESGVFLSLHQPMDENVVSRVSDRLLTLNPPLSLCSTDALDTRSQISLPEVFENFFSDDKVNAGSKCVKVYDPEDISVAPIFDFPFSTFRDEMSSSALPGSKEQPIPIFSCSHPTVRDLTFPKLHYAFLSSNSGGMDDFSPIRVVSQSYIQADQHGSCKWKSLLSIRKIRFHDKGSMWWCGPSGVWMFPAEEENIAIREDDPVVAMLSEADVCPASAQLFRELEEQQRILEATQTKREGIFSTLKQSDMCLVCIAFASWVLKSSDPEAADAWKAALLANVSALSAIQYLRQYVMKKKERPPQDEP